MVWVYKDMCIVYVQNFRDKMVWLVLGNVDIVLCWCNTFGNIEVVGMEIAGTLLWTKCWHEFGKVEAIGNGWLVALC